MKILHVYKTAHPESYGGIESYIDQACKAGRKYGIHADVFTLYSGKIPHDIKYNGYKLYRARRDLKLASTGFSISAFRKFRETVKHYDIIHYHFPWPFMDLLQTLSAHDRPYVITYHSDIVKQSILKIPYAPLMRRFLQKSSAIIATSQNYANTSPVLRKYGEKLHILPIFLDATSYPSPNLENMSRIRAKFGNNFFLYLGALRYYKGIEDAIEAMHNSRSNLLIVGDGPKKNELIRKSLDLKNVHFIGEVNEQEKVDYLSACYGFIFPSNLRSEAFGVSLLEAQLFAKPLITCEIGTGTSYVNIHKKTGFVVAPASPNELRNAMDQLLRSPDLCERFGAYGFKRLDEDFSPRKHFEGLKEIYRKVMPTAYIL